MLVKVNQPERTGKQQPETDDSVPAKLVLNTSSKPSFPPHHRNYYICTGCGAYSCGGVYSSLCYQCNGISVDPPRDRRYRYLCTKCARQYKPCTCDHSVIVIFYDPIYRSPSKYCWCQCCTCCSYSCSCSCCKFFCECLSSKCEHYEPCCYCTRHCSSNLVFEIGECFWSWCPWKCSRPSG